MAKDKPQPQGGPELAEYITAAKPKAYAGGVPVFCAHDAIVPLKDLRPNPKNPNQHPPEQIKLLASVIRATGWRGPITVSTRSGYIVKGHGRLMAAELDDLKEVPVDYQNYASEAEEMADLTADNRIAELATIADRAVRAGYPKQQPPGRARGRLLRRIRINPHSLREHREKLCHARARAEMVRRDREALHQNHRRS